MNNPYTKFILEYFSRIALLNHSVYQLEHILKSYPKVFEERNKTEPLFGTAQIISDWTKSNDNIWEISNPTGISIISNLESERIISQECGYSYSQIFEALEKLFKDLVFIKLKNNFAFFNQVRSSPKTLKFLNTTEQSRLTREKLTGGNTLFEVIKIGCLPIFEDFSLKNEYNYNFQKLWEIFSEIRHSITHSKSSISKSTIYKANKFNEKGLVNHFFNTKEIGKGEIEITFDYDSFGNIQKTMTEFGYQFFKMLSILENLDFKIETIKESPSDCQK
jgi:hypothetical protein